MFFKSHYIILIVCNIIIFPILGGEPVARVPQVQGEKFVPCLKMPVGQLAWLWYTLPVYSCLLPAQ